MLRYSYKTTTQTQTQTQTGTHMLDIEKVINFHVNAAKISQAITQAVENAQAIDQAIILTNSTK